jgi:predicted ATPase/DNA-binding SARP family transcriptional activator
MARLNVSLLGPVQIVLDSDSVVAFPYDKVRALLAYLAAESSRPHRRETLAGLLWPEQDDRAARHSLSQALMEMRRAIHDDADAPMLRVTRDTVQFPPRHDVLVDVATFSSLIDDCDAHANTHEGAIVCRQCAGRLERAVGLYRGAFIEHFSIPDSVAFDEWVLVRREQMHQRAVRALGLLAVYHEARQEHERSGEYMRRLIELDPWNEEAHRRLMLSLTLSGRRAMALEQYERCRQMLADELGVEPDSETTRLYHRIRDGQAMGPHVEIPAMARQPTRSNLPSELTPFIGREQELADVAERLDDPGCRLITLVGPGGIGKTRLAIKAAEATVGAFRHGVHFVPLAGVSSASLLPSAIAGVLDVAFHGQTPPAEQITTSLRDREMLLVLDNIEHLLESAAWIAHLLDQAPGLQIIATSRERLNLRGEWVIGVGGLGLPNGDTTATKMSEAIQLFAHCARRSQSRFALGPDNLSAVARICRLTGGMPLGIELAAAWTPMLSCAEIAEEIERSLDFLSAAARDTADRHRSLRAVFDHSWELLSEHEREVFCRLSVFRGGFQRAAAQEVAGASLPLLSALVTKSLVRRTATGRYDIHELLRQYGEARLAEHPEEERATRDRHSTWFFRFLEEKGTELSGPQQQRALEEIASNIENVHVAWHWAIAHVDTTSMMKGIHSYWLYGEVTGRYQELHTTLGEVLAALNQPTPSPDADHRGLTLARGRTLIHYGSIHVRLGDYQRGEQLIDAGIAVLRSIDEATDLGLALNFKAMFAHLRQDYAQERVLLLESIARFNEADNRWGKAYSLNDLGMVSFLLGDAEEARRLQQQSLDIFAAITDQRGRSFALHNLGIVAGALGEYDEARRFLREALAIRQSIRHAWGVSMSLTQLGVIARLTGDDDEAQSCFLDALQQATEAQSLPAILGALTELTVIWARDGYHDRAASVLAVILDHPAADNPIRDRASELLQELPVAPGTPARPPRLGSPEHLIDQQVRSLLGHEAELSFA